MHRELVSVCDTYAPTDRTVRRWFEQYEAGKSTLNDSPKSGRPVTSVTPENITRIDGIVTNDPKITIIEISEYLGISEGSVREILTHHLLMNKLACRWVPKLLTAEMKRHRVTASRALLSRFRKDIENIFYRLVTGDDK